MPPQVDSTPATTPVALSTNDQIASVPSKLTLLAKSKMDGIIRSKMASQANAYYANLSEARNSMIRATELARLEAHRTAIMSAPNLVVYYRKLIANQKQIVYSLYLGRRDYDEYVLSEYTNEYNTLLDFAKNELSSRDDRETAKATIQTTGNKVSSLTGVRASGGNSGPGRKPTVAILEDAQLAHKANI